MEEYLKIYLLGGVSNLIIFTLNITFNKKKSKKFNDDFQKLLSYKITGENELKFLFIVVTLFLSWPLTIRFLYYYFKSLWKN